MLAGTHELTRADAYFAAALATIDLDDLLGAGRRYAHLAPATLDAGPDPDPWADGIGDRHIVWTLNTPGDDTRTATAHEGRLLVSALYVVKAVGTVDAPADLEQLADAVDAALEGSHAVIGTTGLRAACARRSPVLYPEIPAPGDPIIWHLGALWAIELTT